MIIKSDNQSHQGNVIAVMSQRHQRHSLSSKDDFHLSEKYVNIFHIFSLANKSQTVIFFKLISTNIMMK